LRRIEPLGLIAGPAAAAQAAAGLAREVTAGLYATAFRAVAPGQIGPPHPIASLPPGALPPGQLQPSRGITIRTMPRLESAPVDAPVAPEPPVK